MILAGWIVERRARGMSKYIVMVGLCVSAVVAEFACRDFSVYRGLSGVDAALYCYAAILIAKERLGIGALALC